MTASGCGVYSGRDVEVLELWVWLNNSVTVLKAIDLCTEMGKLYVVVCELCLNQVVALKTIIN